MSLARKIGVAVVAWVGLVTGAHLWLNTTLFDPGGGRDPGSKPFRVGFLPVT
jgi:hypothetical protein